jgi:small-conductance mechanosensitive channel
MKRPRISTISFRQRRLCRGIFQTLFGAIACGLLVLYLATGAGGQGQSLDPALTIPIEGQSSILATMVTLEDQPLFELKDPFLSSSVEQRARRASEQIHAVAKDSGIGLEELRVSEIDRFTLLHAEEVLMLTLSERDAAIAQRSRQELAQDYLEVIREAIAQYRQERSTEYLIRAVITTVIGTLLLLASFMILANIMPRLYRWLRHQNHQWLSGIRIQRLTLLSGQQVSQLLAGIVWVIQVTLVISLLSLYFSYVLSLFPLTRRIGQALARTGLAAITGIWNAFLGYLPNLLVILLIVFIARYILQFVRYFFNEIKNGALTFSGFYPEWADPTRQLISLIVMAVAFALAFPYLPGSNSPAFQGISLFLGVLVSLGSSGAISNIVSGFILVYTRSFQIGDLVQVEAVQGFVEEKMLLVTRIRTLNNELVSIPNSAMLSHNITNFTALMRDSQTPMRLHVSVGLGYDVPWRLVYETLTAAAIATPHILPDPAPFVLQTELHDFYVCYDLKAFTYEAALMERIYSDLHQNIQDKCNEAGIEICSPHYTAIRDGNLTTIPSDYLPEDYQAPGFRVTKVSSSSEFPNGAPIDPSSDRLSS